MGFEGEIPAREHSDEFQSQPRPPAESLGPRLRPAPLVLPALGFMAGLILAESFPAGDWGTAVAVATAVTAIAISLCVYRWMPAVWLHVALVTAAIAFGFVRHQTATRLPENHVGRLAPDRPELTRLAGVIVREPVFRAAVRRNAFLPYKPHPRTDFVLRADELRTGRVIPICGLVRVSVGDKCERLRTGDRVVVTGKFYRPGGPRNPGEFDWARWSRLQGIHAAMFVESADLVRVEAAPASTYRTAARLRSFAQSMLFAPFAGPDDQEAARLLDTMVLGHRSAASAAMNDAFARTGSLHLLAVSGFHVGLLATLVWFLVRRVLRCGERSAALATVAMLLLYAIVAEPNAPILRATIMGVLYCAARIAGRPVCVFNWLAASVLFVLLLNPLDLFRPGFQLSFTMVLAMVTVVPAIYRAVLAGGRWDRPLPDASNVAQLLGRWLLGGVVVVVVAWAVALPLVVYHFERLAPWAPLQALIVTPLATLTILLGFVTILAGAVSASLAWLFAFALHGVTALMLSLVALLARLPGTLIEVTPPPAWLVFATYALLIVACWRYWSATISRPREPADARIPVRSLAAIAGAIAMSWATVYVVRIMVARTRRDLEVHVLAVEDGSAGLVRMPGGDGLLVDGGTLRNSFVGRTIVTAAREIGVRRLVAASVSHANFDHFSGIAAVLGGMPTDSLWLNPYFGLPGEPYRDWLAHVANLTRVTRSRAGDRRRLSGVDVEVLWPPDGFQSADSNDRSLVLRLSFAGRTVMLPGDIEAQAMRGLLTERQAGRIDLHSDVLIAPHHGSVLEHISQEFYQAVNPSAVVVSTGQERPKLIRMMNEAFGGSVPCYSTDELGDVVIRITPDGDLRIGPYFSGARS